ncbi:hypothetical protein CXIVA_08260 [Clostridium sp. SY8519]|nr:hypothetical protein CXIVA_08260 [Clostridium sp. SY8519]
MYTRNRNSAWSGGRKAPSDFTKIFRNSRCEASAVFCMTRQGAVYGKLQGDTGRLGILTEPEKTAKTVLDKGKNPVL